MLKEILAPRPPARPVRSAQHANAPLHAVPRESNPSETPENSRNRPAPTEVQPYADIVWRHLTEAARTYTPAGSFKGQTSGLVTEAQLLIDANGQLVSVEYTDEFMFLSQQGGNFRRFLDAASPFPKPPDRQPVSVRVRLSVASPLP